MSKKKEDSENSLIAENIGPVKECRIDLPEGGGMVVLMGGPGVGKSSLLRALFRLITGKGDVSLRDDAESGRLKIGNAQLKIGANVRPSGELEYATAEGEKFTINDLIDPGIKDEKSADSKRIKALVTLLGMKADCDLFVDLFEDREEMMELMPADWCEESDLVEMAAKVSRILQEKARIFEKESEQSKAKANAAQGSAAGLDLSAECDGKVLQLLLEKAIQSESDLRAADTEAARAAGMAENAKKQLESVASEYTGKTLEQALADHKLAVAEQQSADDKVSQLQAQLSDAQKAAGAARNAVDLAVSNGRAARQHEESMKAWREQLAASIPPRVDPADTAKASQSVTEARQAVENGALIRKAKEQSATVIQHAEEAERLEKKAERLRAAAKATDDVLSSVVKKSGCPLKIDRGRLVIATDRSEKELFAELSAGERAKVAIDIEVNALNGKRGLIPLAQEINEGFNPATRLDVARHAQACGVTIFTALCTDDEELTSEVLP